MRRRAFLRGLGAASGAALSSGLSRIGEPAQARPCDRLRAAGLSVAAKVVVGDGGAPAETEVALGPAGLTRRPFAGGTLALQASPVSGQPDAVDVAATLTAHGRPLPIAVELRLDLSRWSRETYVVLPGACYAGNRFESRRAAYPPLLTEPADIGPNVPAIVSDIPRLELHPGPSRIDVRAIDLATPALGLFWPAARLGLVALVDTGTSLGGVGLALEENDERSAAAVSVRAPAPAQAAWNGEAGSASGRGPFGSLRAGERVTLRARLHLFDCVDPPALFARLFAVRKELTGATASGQELPFSAAFAAHEERVNRRFVETPGFYALGSRDSAYSTWQTGWCGGLGGMLPLLAAGGARSRERAWRTTAFLLAEGQAPSGFFHGLSDGKIWFDDGFSAPLPHRGAPTPPYRYAQRWHLLRRSGDTLFHLMKQLDLLERRPEPPGSERRIALVSQAARRTADAFVRLWDRYHQLGQFVDVDSGELVVGGSTSAGIVPAALALAALRFKHDAYLRVARAAGESFYARYVAAGLACGGPGDALQAPDSESAAALVESFVTLWETTGERIWIARAEAAAHLLASWVISYEPAGAAAGRSGELRATGGVLSDAQSGRGSPGFVLASGDALFRLFRATGDRRLLELLRDTAHNLAQYLPVVEASPAAPHARQTPARTDTAAWLERPSDIVPAGGLLDGIALLTYTELPGLYAQVDRGLVFAFDHVDARLKERLAGKLVVSLTNPTRAEAVVRLYAESSAEAASPLPPGAIAGAPTAVVPAGGSVDVLVPPPAVTARR